MPIISLISEVSGVTLEKFRDSGKLTRIAYDILTELVKRKTEEKIWKRREGAAGTCLIFGSGSLILYFFFYQKKDFDRLGRLNEFFHDPVLLFFGFISLAAAIVFIRFHSKRVEAEDDYDDLRKEVIERENEIWVKEPDEAGRYEVIHFLLKNKDINLFYK
ncbi:DUF2663 family protein [Sporolactobacillus sp. THM7-7]|nr:DUF2663 family protein [Sporolactobacillus sp. THM7-7]